MKRTSITTAEERCGTCGTNYEYETNVYINGFGGVDAVVSWACDARCPGCGSRVDLVALRGERVTV